MKVLIFLEYNQLFSRVSLKNTVLLLQRISWNVFVIL